MPTNFIYSCVQDRQGFLWISTDEGVLRFDGKNFQHYTTDNGLPDIEVLEMAMDSSGIIWANTFKRSPSYYNALTNRFVKAKENNPLSQVINTAVTTTYVLPYGGIAFVNYNGSYFFGRDSLQFIKGNYARFCVEYERNKFLAGKLKKAFFCDGNIIKDSVVIDSSNDVYKAFKSSGNNLYAATSSKIISYYNFQPNTFFKKFEKICVKFSTPVFYFSITKNYVCVSLQNGEIVLLDKYSLKKIESLNISANINNAFEDNDSFLWLCTTDKGLIKASFSPVQKIAIPSSFQNTSLLSVAVDSSGNILAGNRFGEIIKTNDKSCVVKTLQNADSKTWVRKIIPFRKSFFAISDRGLFYNYKQYKFHTNDKKFDVFLNMGLKTGGFYNDSTFLIGSAGRLLLMNLLNGEVKTLKKDQRITAITTAANNEIYYGSTDGLFKCIIKDGVNIISLNQKNKLFGSRITSLACTKDNIVWAATASNGILVLYKDSLMANLTQNNGLSGNLCRTIYVHDSTVWAATNNGISKINYTFQNKKPAFKIQNIGQAEGLHKQLVNDIVQYHDTMYAATTDGIIFFPANITSKKEDANTFITGININGKDTALVSSFKLRYNQNNITLAFAAIDLSGSVYTWQYRINNQPWLSINSNSVSLQLVPGDYIIQIRPVDLNRRIIRKTATIYFNITPAPWQTTWFWILLTAAVTAFTLWQYNRSKLQKQKRLFEQQTGLMKERNRITADLHDDVGSSLSSLQINSVIAKQMLDADKDKAKYYLDKITEQSADINSNISDIIWSMKQQEDRLVDMDGRIRNMISNLLGATNINYSIDISRPVDAVVKNITARKNIMLIIKEATNNCAKYSNASAYNLAIIADENNFIIDINDNGKGIAKEKMKLGNGLQNMHKRITELKGTLHLQTAENEGVQLKFIIPATEIRG